MQWTLAVVIIQEVGNIDQVILKLRITCSHNDRFWAKSLSERSIVTLSGRWTVILFLKKSVFTFLNQKGAINNPCSSDVEYLLLSVLDYKNDPSVTFLRPYPLPCGLAVWLQHSLLPLLKSSLVALVLRLIPRWLANYLLFSKTHFCHVNRLHWPAGSGRPVVPAEDDPLPATTTYLVVNISCLKEVSPG